MKKKIIIGLVIVLVIIIIGVIIQDKNKAPGVTYKSTAAKITGLVHQYNQLQDPSSEAARDLLGRINKLIAQQAKQGNTGDESPVVPVYIDEIHKGNIAKTLAYIGDIHAETMVRVYSKIPDRINRFYVENGAYVNAGDPIAQIENNKLLEALNRTSAGLNSALAQMVNVQAEFKRAATLFEAKAMSQSQYDQVKTQRDVTEEAVKQARAAYFTTKTQLEDALIKAPIGGTVADRILETGDMAPVQMPLVSIYQMDTVKAIVRLSEQEVGQIRLGMTANIQVTAYPDTTFAGQVAKISPIVNPQTRTVEAEIQIQNPGHLLKPGMFAEVKILVLRRDNTLVIHKNDVDTKTSLLQTGRGLRESTVKKEYSVFVVQDSMARQRAIQVGIESDDFYEVTAGLQPGDKVVSVGRTNLNDSSRVSIKN